MLEVEDLVKSFGSLVAIDHVTLAVAAHTITGLIGPNGAGKTTLFNTIAGTSRADTGQIRLHGERIDGDPPDAIFRRGLARTFQIPRPFREMTVLENMMMVPGHQAGERFWASWVRYGAVRREERAIREQALEVLGFCGLQSLAGDLAKTLSGGQQKLLELARVLMGRPSLILLDEPSAGVNPALMDSLLDRILDLQRRGVTFLIIEHNMDLVMSVCHPILVMAQG
ncbi:MAG TPA: ABC transporter ATP-binding protein, partial [Methylomirabilota bacterium]|nr:ABC transporter ATP-binding protein [Methylomirabilota bacterium]